MDDVDLHRANKICQQLHAVLRNNKTASHYILLSALSTTLSMTLGEAIVQLDQDLAMDLVDVITKSVKAKSFDMAKSLNEMRKESGKN